VKASGLQHRIASGETLSEIAASYRVPVSTLASLNGIRSPYMLRAGQVLALPTGAATPKPTPVLVASRSASRVAASGRHGRLSPEPSQLQAVRLRLGVFLEQALIGLELLPALLDSAQPEEGGAVDVPRLALSIVDRERLRRRVCRVLVASFAQVDLGESCERAQAARLEQQRDSELGMGPGGVTKEQVHLAQILVRRWVVWRERCPDEVCVDGLRQLELCAMQRADRLMDAVASEERIVRDDAFERCEGVEIAAVLSMHLREGVPCPS
jgi:murein DD-endopeptidase MepM/ murein hydrolase activator NlpD